MSTENEEVGDRKGKKSQVSQSAARQQPHVLSYDATPAKYHSDPATIKISLEFIYLPRLFLYAIN